MFRPARLVGSSGPSRHDRVVVALLAVAAYVPMLLTSPGRVSADTKTYLTLDPAEVLRQATSMWDPTTGAGTIPHQNIGYLFPLGPYYWLMERLAVPDWITQRLIWGTLIFAAALGAYRLARWLGWTVIGAAVVAVSYGFSPYLLSYLARLSVILGPWAALPWMILLAAKAARTSSWRPAAWFAIVVLLVGSVNATALVLAGLGPVLWLLADGASGRVRWRAIASGAGRIAVLSLAVSLWWIVALRIQGAYGIPILRYTETYQTVAGASTPAEILRGLGYWFFYGSDRLDRWVGPSLPYLDSPLLIALGFAIAGLSLLGLLVAFSGRVACAALLVVGLGVSVGAAPLGNSTPYGAAFEWLSTNSTAAMALRSTPRAAPLVILALAFGLAAAVEWVRRSLARRPRRRRRSLAVPVSIVALLVVQLFPWFTGDVLTASLLRDAELPDHQTELADWLDASVDPDSAGRVYELPAADFAYYRWGGTVDPVLPGIIDRPYLARELVPQGGAATVDLLDALERRIPEGWFEPEALRAFAELFAVETIAVRNDLEHERLRLARPGPLWTDLTSALGEPDHEGPIVTDTPVIPLLDEVTLAHLDAADEFPVVAAFELGAAPLVTSDAVTDPVVVSGSGDGIVDMAAAGLLDPTRPLLYAATLDDLAGRDQLPDGALGTSPWWVFTDTNRKEARHWSGISSNRGALEPAGEIVIDDDPGDNRLDVFPTDIDQQTHAVHLADVTDVRASYYGNRIAFTPEDAPWFAIDGDPTTAWRAAVFDDARGLVWEVDLAAAVSPGELTILQPVTGVTSRYITRVSISFDGDDTIEVDLDERSRTEPGQAIPIPDVEFSALRIEILADSVGPLANYAAQPGVGFAEVTIPGVHDDRVVDVPGLDDFPSIGADEQIVDLADDRLTYVLTRSRIDPATSNRTSPEPAMSRRIDVPENRVVAVHGEARLAADADESTIALALGEDGSAVADRRLPGSPGSRGQSAFDGDVATAWQTPFGDPTGATVTVPDARGSRGDDVDDEVTVSWLDDGMHSLPAGLTFGFADGTVEIVELPATTPTDGVATATLPLGSAQEVTSVTVSAVDRRTSPEYFSGVEQTLPIGIAEITFDPTAAIDHTSEDPLPDDCRDDVVTLDGEPLPVRITGTHGDATARRELALIACDLVELAAGTHRLDVVAGRLTGFDIDRLILDSPGRPAVPAGTSDGPPVTIVRDEPTSVDVEVAASSDASWVILQQSWNAGWTASVGGTDLGPPVLIDGYANGWILPPGTDTRTVELRWTPQRSVTIALWVSLFAAIGTLVIAVATRRRAIPLDVDGSVDRAGRRLGGVATLVLLAVALVAVAGPLVAAAGLVTAWVARRHPGVAVAVVVAAGAVVAGSVVALEWRRDLPADPQWPSEFGWTAPLAWLAVAVVVSVAVSSAVLPAKRPGDDPRAE